MVVLHMSPITLAKLEVDTPVGTQIRSVNTGNIEYSLKELVVLTEEEIAIMNATPKPKNPSFNDSFILYDYFDMHKFYRKGWTISNKMNSPSKWISGPYYFSNYMNGDFKSRQLNNTESMNNLLVYVANTTQSVVSQIMGVCDSLLLALFNERQFQFHAPALAAHLFDTAFPNMIYPVEVKGRALADRYENLTTDFVNAFKHKLVYTGYENDGSFSLTTRLSEFDDAVVLSALTNFTDSLYSQPKYRSIREQIFGVANSQKLGDMDWMGVCTTGMLRPSKYLSSLLNKWMYRFKQHTVLGVQISVARAAHDAEAKISESRLDVLYAWIDKFMDAASKPMIFVTSDSKEYVEKILERYNGHCLTSKTQFQTQPGFTPLQAKYYHDIIDLFLLSRCHELVITTGSHFGQLAVSMNPRLSRVTPSVFNPNKKVMYF